MNTYLDLCRFIFQKGSFRKDRTNTGTKSVFGYQMRFNLEEGFPLLTTKKMNLRSIIHELLWFLKGDTNIFYLVQNNVNIWNEWPYQKYQQSDFFQNETLKEFVKKIKNDPLFATKHGNLGPVYGKQWRDFNGVDQIKFLISEIKANPNSRRLILNSWNPSLLNQMALPPCHVLIQFYVHQGKLSLQLYQRSGDVFLGIPFNIASYSLLLMMVAQVTNLQPYEFIHTLGDAHIYSNHITQVQTQIQRTPKKLPQMILNPDIKNIDDFKFIDFILKNYQCDGILKGDIAV
ncbi:thymidylate synthase [Aster yellows witches'-broom phytoplasma AYWB]|uniref:Thymidylate synthase n=2 Tax=16SrI (Aster yellows group) TaxID=3042590 RepID=TYSY_AYWBP|nr:MULTISPECIES: thymidylate synthase [16SrI (Aster yellows group)]Q2NJ46.1 RecName: Full=Thymidylate synthase; Short=TS; Short=TSase [Aster yellows witches'-broom phytoplasma AYWB]ABC65547.1 thymidylate synthase [Aster yellows witches'-broom phytoplasma AYWB]PEH36233.1 thymidylate synthase [New Jersey aster yellows phytoplasma]